MTVKGLVSVREADRAKVLDPTSKDAQFVHIKQEVWSVAATTLSFLWALSESSSG